MPACPPACMHGLASGLHPWLIGTAPGCNLTCPLHNNAVPLLAVRSRCRQNQRGHLSQSTAQATGGCTRTHTHRLCMHAPPVLYRAGGGLASHAGARAHAAARDAGAAAPVCAHDGAAAVPAAPVAPAARPPPPPHPARAAGAAHVPPAQELHGASGQERAAAWQQEDEAVERALETRSHRAQKGGAM